MEMRNLPDERVQSNGYREAKQTWEKNGKT